MQIKIKSLLLFAAIFLLAAQNVPAQENTKVNKLMGDRDIKCLALSWVAIGFYKNKEFYDKYLRDHPEFITAAESVFH